MQCLKVGDQLSINKTKKNSHVIVIDQIVKKIKGLYYKTTIYKVDNITGQKIKISNFNCYNDIICDII